MARSKLHESSYIFKVLLIGEAAVGKTSLTMKFISGKFKWLLFQYGILLVSKDLTFFEQCSSEELKQHY
ncbi:MAG: hypothetical protein ACTSPM_11915 [Candidatus Heimdallarchaeota archaeon]